MIQASERVKTVHVLDRSATVTGHRGTWRSRSIIQSFLTSELDVSHQLHPPAAVAPGKQTPVLIV
jgi:hypothetical protein